MKCAVSQCSPPSTHGTVPVGVVYVICIFRAHTQTRVRARTSAKRKLGRSIVNRMCYFQDEQADARRSEVTMGISTVQQSTF